MNESTGSDSLFPPYKQWYRFGLRAPSILYRRIRNRYQPVLAIRTSYQRTRYGIADSDAWGLDFFLAKTTVRGVQKLRKWAHGHPPEITAEEWDSILAQIEVGFQAWLDSDGHFTDTGKVAQFDTAMKLYARWFSALWD